MQRGEARRRIITVTTAAEEERVTGRAPPPLLHYSVGPLLLFDSIRLVTLLPPVGCIYLTPLFKRLLSLAAVIANNSRISFLIQFHKSVWLTDWLMPNRCYHSMRHGARQSLLLLFFFKTRCACCSAAFHLRRYSFFSPIAIVVLFITSSFKLILIITSRDYRDGWLSRVTHFML